MGERNVTRKNVELNTDNVEWFESHYPRGSMSTIISMLFDKFCETHQMTPKQYADLAVEELNEDLKRASNS